MRLNSARTKVTPAVTPKREAILRAALEVFSEHGVHGVAVPEIAARAQVGTGTIYRCFESKEVLVNELFRELKQSLGRRLSASYDQASEPAEVFAEFWSRMVAFVREEPQAYRFLELQDHLPYLDEDSRAVERKVLSPIANACRLLQRKRVFRRDLRAEVMMALIWGALVGLFKSERHGYLTVSARDVAAAREACWRMCAAQ